jgi:hypothetical protein
MSTFFRLEFERCSIRISAGTPAAFSYSSSVPPGKYRSTKSIRSRSFPSGSFPTRQTSHNLTLRSLNSDTVILSVCLSVCLSVLSIYLSIRDSTALCWTSAAFSVSWSFSQSVGLLVRGSARRKASTYTQDSTNTEQTYTDIHAPCGIRTHDPSAWRAKAVNALDRAATVVGLSYITWGKL